MSSMGRALMGTGRATGDRRALEAAQQAISSPLLEDVSIDGATGILINITGGPDLTLFEVNEASTLIQEAAHEEANIIFGSVIDSNLKEEVRITVIATGFDRLPAETADGYAKRVAVGAPPRVVQAQQIALPYAGGEREITKEYPPPASKAPARRLSSGEIVIGAPQSAPPAVRIAAPILDAARPEDMTEKAILTGDRTEAAAAAAAAMAQGTAPPTPPVVAEKVKDAKAKNSGAHAIPRVHPSLQQALADVEIEDEFDIPTFLRRHNSPPVG
jgi:hypothetical protein